MKACEDGHLGAARALETEFKAANNTPATPTKPVVNTTTAKNTPATFSGFSNGMC